MTEYEKLLQEAYNKNFIVREVSLHSNAEGLCKGDKIAINKNKVKTNAHKYCVLAEELAHQEISHGNIIDLNSVDNKKQEIKARNKAYERVVNLEVVAHLVAYKNFTKYEVIDFLNVTEVFFNDAIEYYSKKYGPYKKIKELTITFKPNLAVIKNL